MAWPSASHGGAGDTGKELGERIKAYAKDAATYGSNLETAIRSLANAQVESATMLEEMRQRMLRCEAIGEKLADLGRGIEVEKATEEARRAAVAERLDTLEGRCAASVSKHSKILEDLASRMVSIHEALETRQSSLEERVEKLEGLTASEHEVQARGLREMQDLHSILQDHRNAGTVQLATLEDRVARLESQTSSVGRASEDRIKALEQQVSETVKQLDKRVQGISADMVQTQQRAVDSTQRLDKHIKELSAARAQLEQARCKKESQFSMAGAPATASPQQHQLLQHQQNQLLQQQQQQQLQKRVGQMDLHRTLDGRERLVPPAPSVTLLPPGSPPESQRSFRGASPHRRMLDARDRSAPALLTSPSAGTAADKDFFRNVSAMIVKNQGADIQVSYRLAENVQVPKT